MTTLYIRVRDDGTNREFVEIENENGESVDIISDAIADGEDTLLELDVTENGVLREKTERWEQSAKYAENKGYWREHDGIMGCVDEIEWLINDD